MHDNPTFIYYQSHFIDFINCQQHPKLIFDVKYVSIYCIFADLRTRVFGKQKHQLSVTANQTTDRITVYYFNVSRKIRLMSRWPVNAAGKRNYTPEEA